MIEPADRVTIRRAEPEDAETVQRWRAQPSTGRFQPTEKHDLEAQRGILKTRRATPISPTTQGKMMWLILHNDIPAGWVTLDVTSRQSNVALIGYTVDEAFRGRRIASRGLRHVTQLAFDPHILRLERLEANVAVQNIASQRVLLAAGFRQEGLARGLLLIGGVRLDHYRYGLLKSDLPTIRSSPSE